MKIIETRTAPNPRRVRIFLAEKQIDVAFEQRDLMQSELKAAEFTALNPMQRVPILLLDDGTVIAESIAICRYFEELHPTPALFGSDPLSRAQVEMWQRRLELGLFFHIAQVFRHLNSKMAHLEVPQVAAWGEANKPKINEQLYLLDHHLATTQFIAGERFSIADITALVAIDFLKPCQLRIPQDCSNVARWYQEIAARPSALA